MVSFILYMVFIISYFLHLPARFPGLGEMRFDFILMGMILLSTIFVGIDILRKQEKLKTMKFFLLLIAYIIVTIPLVEWPGSVIRHGLENYSKVGMFFLFTISIVDTEKKLRIFMFIFLVCQIFRVVEPAYLHITTGYWGDLAYSHKDGSLISLNRLSGSPSDVVNPNQLAWVIVSIIPFMYYLAWQGNKTLKFVFLSVLPVLIYALMLTGSRSGLLSLFAVIIAIIILSEKKVMNIAIWAVIALPVFLIISTYLSADLRERYMSLFDPTVAGRDTAMGRLEGVKKDLATIFNKPLVGHGLGTSREVSANFLRGKAQIAHNLYVETLQEIGLIGFVIFMQFIRTLFNSLTEAKKKLTEGMASSDSFLIRLILSIQAWVIMDLFYSLSCFGLSSWEWYLFGGVATVCLMLAKEYVNEAESVQYPGVGHAVLSQSNGKAI